MRNFNTVVGTCWAMLFGAALLGCSSATDDDTAPTLDGTGTQKEPVELGEANRLLSLELEPEHAVDFHEIQPGNIVAVETMLPGMQPALPEVAGLSILEQYEQLRPGEAIPEFIRAAAQRAEAFRAGLADDLSSLDSQAGGGTPASPAGQLQLQHSSSSGSHFIADGRCPTGNVYQVCYTNWMHGFFGYATSKGAYWYVDSYDMASEFGYIVVSITHPTDAGCRDYSAAQGEGTVKYFESGCIGALRQRRIDIGLAAYDAFHVGGAWYN
jgi:hypothetical protein